MEFGRRSKWLHKTEIFFIVRVLTLLIPLIACLGFDQAGRTNHNTNFRRPPRTLDKVEALVKSKKRDTDRADAMTMLNRKNSFCGTENGS